MTIVSATVRPRQSRACQEARPRARRNEAKNGLPMDRIDPPEERNRDDSREESVDSSSNSARSSSADSNSVAPGPANGVPNGISRARSETTRSGQDARGKKSAVDGSTTVGTARPGPVCRVCPLRSSCRSICEVIEAILPSPERGRVDAEDLPRLFSGMRMVRALLDFAHLLTDRQQEVVRLYYRESLQQQEIAERLGISQQAVHDSLRRARKTIGEKVVQGGGAVANGSAAESSVPTTETRSVNVRKRRLDS